MNSRIGYLDGLRGVAIASVVLFHGFVSNPLAFSKGDSFNLHVIFEPFRVGVPLFFLISGFVINLSLTRGGTFAGFVKRRWLRLFPEMLICSVMFFLVALIFPVIDGGPRSLLDLIPGLTFLDPRIISFIARTHVESLQGPFWSLYVEVLFYFVFGLSFQKWGSATAAMTVGVLGMVYGAALTLTMLAHLGGGIKIVKSILGFAGVEWFPWFASGAFFFLFVDSKKRVFAASSAAFFLMGAIFFCKNLGDVFACIVVYMIFIGPAFSRFMRSVLAFDFMIFLGFISYPLYLNHETIVISLNRVISKILPSDLYFMSPALPIAFLCGVAWIVAKWLAPRLRQLLLRYVFPKPSPIQS